MTDTSQKGRPRSAHFGRLAFTVLALGTAPWITARAADTCESTFKSSGSPASGLMFDARTSAGNVNANDAIEQMKVIGAAEEFTVGPARANGANATLVLVQEATSVARGFEFQVSAQDRGPVTMHVGMPAGMKAKDEDVRIVMCRMLGQIKPVGQASVAQARTRPADSAPVVSVPAALLRPALASSGPLPGPVTSQASTQLCMANWTNTMTDVAMRDTTYGTWTLGSGSDEATVALGRVKQALAGMPDLKLRNETYHDRAGLLTIDVVQPDAYVVRPLDNSLPDMRPFPLELEYDASMGAVSVVVRPNQEQLVRDPLLRYVACTLAAVVNHAAMPKVPKDDSKRSLFNNPFKKASDPAAILADTKRQQVDAKARLYQRAFFANKAIVVTPNLDVSGKYWQMSERDRLVDAMVDYWMDLTAVILWQRQGSTKEPPLRTGYHTGIASTGLRGFVGSLVGPGKIYGVYFVEPGTYELTGAVSHMRRATLPPTSGERWRASASLGTLALATTQDVGFFKTKEWHDAMYDAIPYENVYCVAEHVPSGRCVSTVTEKLVYRPKVIEEGYHDSVGKRTAPGLTLTASLSKPFATFKVGAGQVAYVDGFAVDADSATIDPKACMGAGTEVATCALAQLSIWRYAADDNLISMARRAYGDSKDPLAKVWRDAKPVPVSLNPSAKVVEGTGDPLTGESRYALKVP